MKKGISLIVLVITIIVMIIIAGAIIISLNSSNIIKRADDAVIASDVANLRSALTMEYAEILSKNHDGNDADDLANDVDKAEANTAYNNILNRAEFAYLKDKGYSVAANDNLTPELTYTAPASNN